MNPDSENTSTFDSSLAEIPGLTWLPWVGSNYAKMPDGRRVLIVGESHYTDEKDPEKIEQSIQKISRTTFTREVVQQSLINWECDHRTFSTMHKLFYSPEDCAGFWADLSFYNFVQRPMRYRNGNPERPIWEDFWKGWEVFLKVVEILNPDHVLFIGVEAANHFNGFMALNNQKHVSVEWVEKVGVAYARTARLTVNDAEVPLHFIKHCGSYFSTDRWSDYLHRNARDLMASISASARAVLPDAPSRRLHVLGMAKSCLDLRGANAPKLELDFLRLASAIRDFEEMGEEAVGYLMVLDEKVETRAKGWREKYGTGDKILVRKANIPADELDALRKEKTQHVIGMLKKYLLDDGEMDLSVAELGKKLGESALSSVIEKDYPDISSLHDQLTREALPLKVAWDYYGTLNTEH